MMVILNSLLGKLTPLPVEKPKRFGRACDRICKHNGSDPEADGISIAKFCPSLVKKSICHAQRTNGHMWYKRSVGIGIDKIDIFSKCGCEFTIQTWQNWVGGDIEINHARSKSGKS